MRLWSIELNLNDDPLNACAWHVDDLKTTCLRNLRHAILSEKLDPWVLVSIVESDEFPSGESERLRRLIGETRFKEGIDKELRTPYGLEELILNTRKEK